LPEKSPKRMDMDMEIKPPSERSSEKHLQKIASSLATQKQQLSSVEYILDPVDARVKKDESCGLDEKDQAELWKRLDELNNMKNWSDSERKETIIPIDSPKLDFKKEAIKCFPNERTDTTVQEQQNNFCIDVSSPIKPYKQDVENNVAETSAVNNDTGNCNNAVNPSTSTENGDLCGCLDACEKMLDSIGMIPLVDMPPGIDSEHNIAPQKHHFSLQCDSTKIRKHLSEFRTLVGEMHQTVSETINQIRHVERSWMNTTTKAVGFKNFLKVGDMLDYVYQTIVLLSDSQFMAHVYPETKTNILKALDPVYREFHSCFIALGELAETVSTDAIYLKELVENLPKGIKNKMLIKAFEYFS
jgi:hypothetical protein